MIGFEMEFKLSFIIAEMIEHFEISVCDLKPGEAKQIQSKNPSA